MTLRFVAGTPPAMTEQRSFAGIKSFQGSKRGLFSMQYPSQSPLEASVRVPSGTFEGVEGPFSPSKAPSTPEFDARTPFWDSSGGTWGVEQVFLALYTPLLSPTGAFYPSWTPGRPLYTPFTDRKGVYGAP